MPLFEVDAQRPVLVSSRPSPAPAGMDPDAHRLVDSHVDGVLGEQLFPVARGTGPDEPHLLALDAAGTPVVVELVAELDDDALARALDHAGAAGRLTRSDLAARYAGGPAAFARDVEAFYDDVPLTRSQQPARAGARLVVLCTRAAPAVLHAVDFLRQPSLPVEVLRLDVVATQDGRRLVDVSPLVVDLTGVPSTLPRPALEARSAGAGEPDGASGRATPPADVPADVFAEGVAVGLALTGRLPVVVQAPGGERGRTGTTPTPLVPASAVTPPVTPPVAAPEHAPGDEATVAEARPAPLPVRRRSRTDRFAATTPQAPAGTAATAAAPAPVPPAPPAHAPVPPPPLLETPPADDAPWASRPWSPAEAGRDATAPHDAPAASPARASVLTRESIRTRESFTRESYVTRESAYAADETGRETGFGHAHAVDAERHHEPEFLDPEPREAVPGTFDTSYAGSAGWARGEHAEAGYAQAGWAEGGYAAYGRSEGFVDDASSRPAGGFDDALGGRYDDPLAGGAAHDVYVPPTYATPPADDLLRPSVGTDTGEPGRDVVPVPPPPAPGGVPDEDDPDLDALARSIGEPVRIVWSRPRRGQLFEALLHPDGAIEITGGERYHHPDAAAAAVSGSPTADGWSVWRFGEGGPTLTDVFRERFS